MRRTRRLRNDADYLCLPQSSRAFPTIHSARRGQCFNLARTVNTPFAHNMRDHFVMSSIRTTTMLSVFLVIGLWSDNTAAMGPNFEKFSNDDVAAGPVGRSTRGKLKTAAGDFSRNERQFNRFESRRWPPQFRRMHRDGNGFHDTFGFSEPRSFSGSIFQNRAGINNGFEFIDGCWNGPQYQRLYRSQGRCSGWAY